MGLKRLYPAPTFSLSFGLGYAVAVYLNQPLFRYYPLTGQFSWVDLQTTDLGPAMTWYGWMAVGLLFALVVTPLIPKRVADRVPALAYWVLLAAMFYAAWVREQSWFVS